MGRPRRWTICGELILFEITFIASADAATSPRSDTWTPLAASNLTRHLQWSLPLARPTERLPQRILGPSDSGQSGPVNPAATFHLSFSFHFQRQSRRRSRGHSCS
jgi:hypothetical protein